MAWLTHKRSEMSSAENGEFEAEVHLWRPLRTSKLKADDMLEAGRLVP